MKLAQIKCPSPTTNRISILFTYWFREPIHWIIYKKRLITFFHIFVWIKKKIFMIWVKQFTKSSITWSTIVKCKKADTATVVTRVVLLYQHSRMHSFLPCWLKQHISPVLHCLSEQHFWCSDRLGLVICGSTCVDTGAGHCFLHSTSTHCN